MKRIVYSQTPLCVLIIPEFKPGDPPPDGYLQWHEWARVQHKNGLKQRKCRVCGLWRFPQEKCCDETKNRTQKKRQSSNYIPAS